MTGQDAHAQPHSLIKLCWTCQQWHLWFVFDYLHCMHPYTSRGSSSLSCDAPELGLQVPAKQHRGTRHVH